MASSCGSFYASSPETTNYARICRIVVDVLRDILWQVLTNEILPADLPQKVQIYINKLGKLNLKIKTWLCGISPPSTEIPSAEKFDVSSLYTLIRNLCSQVPAPSTQWGQIPTAGGITLGDDIERVREFRNTLYGHATQATIENADFNKLCIEIKNIVSRFDKYFCSKGMKCDFKCEIDTILLCFMDKRLEDDYIEKMKEIAILSDGLVDVKQQVGDLTKTLESVRDAVYDVQKDGKENAEDSRNRLCRIQESLDMLHMEKEKDKVEGTTLVHEEQDSNKNAGIELEMPQGMEGKICIIKCFVDLKLELTRDIVMDIAKEFFRKKKHKDVLEDLHQAGTRRLCIDRLLKRVLQLETKGLKIFFDLLKRKCPEIAQKLAEIEVTDKDLENFTQVSESVQEVPQRIQNGLKFEQLDVEFFQCHFKDIPEKVDQRADVLLTQFRISICDHSQMMQYNDPVKKIHALLEKIQSCHFDSDSEVQSVLGSKLYQKWQHFKVDGSRQGSAPAWNFKLKNIRKAWWSIEGVLLEELSPRHILDVFTEERLLSPDQCQDLRKKKRREMSKELLQILKDDLPDAFFVLLKALKEDGEDELIHLLTNIIDEKKYVEEFTGLENQGIWYYLQERIQRSKEYVTILFRKLRMLLMEASEGSLVLKFVTLDNFDVKLLKLEAVKTKLWDMIKTLCPEYQDIFKEPVHLTIFLKPLSNTDRAEIYFYLETRKEKEVKEEDMAHSVEEEFSRMKLRSHNKHYIVEEMNPASLNNWMFNTLPLDEDTRTKLRDLVSRKDMSRRKKMKILLNIVESLGNGYELLEKYCEEHDAFLYDNVFKKHRQIMVEENPDGAQQYKFSHEKEEGLQRLSSTWIDFTVDPKGSAPTWNFKLENIRKAWWSIEGVLLEELSPRHILDVFTEERLLSPDQCQDLRKKKRREMSKELLQIVKDDLPDAFFILLKALKEDGEDELIHLLTDIIDEKKYVEEFTGSAPTWSFKLENIRKAWWSIEGVLLEELSPRHILDVFTEERLLSPDQCQDLRKKKRREMSKELLQIVKDDLPDAFFILLKALKEDGEDELIHLLTDIIDEKKNVEEFIVEKKKQIWPPLKKKRLVLLVLLFVLVLVVFQIVLVQIVLQKKQLVLEKKQLQQQLEWLESQRLWPPPLDSSLPPILPDIQPTERQLGRISMKIGYKSVILGQALGLSEADIQQIQKVYSHTATQNLMICFKWMLQSGDKATFRNLEMAFKRIDIDTDILESVNKAVDSVSCLPPDMQNMQPEDKHLNQISNRIETDHVHLGVELEVPLSRIEQILTDNLVDVHRQCFEIMKEWRQRKDWQATFWKLENAFISVGIDPDILKESLK